MNNLRLLTGLLYAVLSGCWICCLGQNVMTLEELFAIAEANSPQLRPSLTSLTEAEREISVAKADRLPDINASLSLSYIGDGFTTERDFSDYQRAPIPHFGNTLSVSVSQPVYTGGALTSAIELADMKLTAARYASDFQRDNIRFRLAGFYLDIYKYTNLREVVSNNIDAACKVLDEMHARYEQGTALRNDITRYELLVSDLRLQLIKIDNTIAILNASLVSIAGMEPGTVITPDPAILDRSLPADGAAWWHNEAVANSPVLSMARTQVDISRKAESLVLAEKRPHIGLQAAWSLDGPILVELPPINRNLSYWYVGVGVSYNLSSLYKADKSMARCKAATLTAMDRLDAEEANLSLAVTSDHIRHLEAYEELKTQQKSVELAERNYQTTSTRYAADMALITDMLDAANAKLDAEQRLVNARINIIYSYYKLLFTSGTI